jgi:TonB-dependent starch-binding outer membrane protein SusC
MPPIYPVYTDEGFLGGTETIKEFNNYSLILLRAFNGHPLFRINDEIRNEGFETIGNIYMDINILEGLNFNTAVSGFYKRVDNSNYQAKDRGMGESYFYVGRFDVSSSKTINYIWKNLIQYDKVLDKHSINIMGGYEYNFLDGYSHSGVRKDYNDDEIPYLTAGSTVLNANDNRHQSCLISIFGRLNYNYMGKYLTTASFRRDGSSRFGPNNKWGNFPSVSAGWIISEESFMDSFSSISNLKIRVSYGFTGNNAIGNYQWISHMGRRNVAVGEDLVISYYPSNIENPNLAWERSEEWNYGIDLGLFNQRLVIEGDLFYNTSDNLLLDVPVPTQSGFTSVLTNIGEVKNNGVELSIISRNIQTKLNWETQLNFNLIRSEVTQLGPDESSMYYGTGSFGNFNKINKLGETPFSFYGYKCDGVYMNQEEVDNDPAAYHDAKPGCLRYVDIDGDGELTADDRTILGSYEPDYSFYLTNNFSYGKFDFSFMIQGVVGNTIYDDNAHRSLFYHYGRNFLSSVATHRWRSIENPGDGYHPKLTVDKYSLETVPSSFWLDDGTFFRLKDVTVGYSMPNKILSKIGVSYARVFFNGANLFTIQKAKGIYDPETFIRTTDYTSQQQIGVSGAAYPTAKTYSFGINVEF